MRHKTFDLIETKADEETGTFTALVSVFGNVDHVGDRVMPGAFKRTLEEWRAKGDPIPVVLSHQWENPMAHIGVADPRAVMETEKGLVVQGKIDTDTETARQVHKLMQRRSLKSFSFGYTVPAGGEKLNKEDGANELSELDLIEVGPTLKGANEQAELLDVKSALDVEVPEIVVDPKTKGHNEVGPEARAKLRNLIAYYMKKPHPFTACVRDNTKRFGEEGAKRVCATLKDIGMGTTHWRHGGSSDEPETKDAQEERDFEQELYDAAGGDMDGLMEMWEEHMVRNGDKAQSTEGSDATVEVKESPFTQPPFTGEALEKAIEESDRFQAIIAERVEERLKAEREAQKAEESEDFLEPDGVVEAKDLPVPVENAESEKPAVPVKPAAKDDLKNENERLRLQIATDDL